jgi:hypothetical protein
MRPFPEDAAIAVVPEGSYAAGCSAPSHHHVSGRTSLGGRIAGSSARSHACPGMGLAHATVTRGDARRTELDPRFEVSRAEAE